MNESQKNQVEELNEELEDEEKNLKKLPTHGAHLGMVEFQDMAKNHPKLLEFFEKADEVLELNDEAEKRLLYLEKRYLDGVITDSELKELEEKFFNPYYTKKPTS